MNILEKINTQINTFSKSERKVAEVIIANPEKAIHSSIATLAKVADVSEPTVNRFCRRLDTKGFPDFKLHLAQGLANGTPYVNRHVDENDGPEEYSAKIFESTMAALDIAKRNLELCFPNMSHADREELLKEVFIQQGMGLIEMAQVWWPRPKALLNRYHIEGLEHYHRAKQAHQGVLLLGGHYSVLELGAGSGELAAGLLEELDRRHSRARRRCPGTSRSALRCRHSRLATERQCPSLLRTRTCQ